MKTPKPIEEGSLRCMPLTSLDKRTLVDLVCNALSLLQCACNSEEEMQYSDLLLSHCVLALNVETESGLELEVGAMPCTCSARELAGSYYYS